MDKSRSTDGTPAAVGDSALRILNGVALTLIVLAVLARLMLYRSMHAGFGDTSLAFDGFRALISFAVIPGTVLALAKLILNIIRSFKQPAARIKAAMYFLIVMLPVALPRLPAVSTHADTQPLAQQAETEESEQFLEGQEWAKANRPLHDSECKGVTEFNRGCRHQIELRRKAQRDEGYEWARENLPEKASQCQGVAYFVLGCRTYFMEHLRKPRPAGLGDYQGMTTAECIEEVNSNYEASAALDMEREDLHAVEVTRRKHWLPDLAGCENNDKPAQYTFMSAAYARLESAIGNLKAEQDVSEDERASILRDFTEMSKLKEQPYTKAYLQRFDEYSSRLNGEYQEPEIQYPQISCQEYQGKIDEMRRIDKERSDAMQALRRPGGIVTDGGQYSSLNQQRIDGMSEWKLYTDGAKKAGCDIATH